MRILLLFGICFLYSIKTIIAQIGECNAFISSQEATIIIPQEASPKVNNNDLPIGSIIQVYFIEADTVQCAGSTVWEGGNTSITVYGKDSDTPGYQDDEEYKFRFILPSECIIDNIEATFLNGSIFNTSSNYKEDGISGIESIIGISNFEIEVANMTPDTCQQGVGKIELRSINGNFPITYEWSNNNTQDSILTELNAGDSISVIAFDYLGCPATILDFVVGEIEILPVINLNENFLLCQGDSIQLSGGDDGILFEWLHNGDALNGLNTAIINIAVEGIYTLNITNSFGCSSRDSTEVFIRLPPPLNLQNDTSICQNESINLDVFCLDCTYNWSTNEATPTINISSGGNYVVTITNEFNCSSADSIQLTVHENPVVNLGENQIICEGEVVQIGLEAMNGFEYIWQNNESTSQIFVESAGLFSLTITDNNTCQGNGNIDISYLPPIIASIDIDKQTICPGQSIQLSAQGGTAYLWISGLGSLSNDSISNPTASPIDSTIYTVIVSNDCFTDTSQTTITLFDISANAGVDTCIIIGDEIELNASGGVTYQWKASGDFSTDNNISNPIANPEDSTFFFVTITDNNACITKDSVQIAVLESLLDAFDAINIITPNGDGVNDVLKFDGLKKSQKNKITIFNRWGNIVYQKLKYENDWDGTYKGKPLPAGSYFYILKINEFEIKSALTILRD